jgi:hypothetical protein
VGLRGWGTRGVFPFFFFHGDLTRIFSQENILKKSMLFFGDIFKTKQN